ncbi:uncharacterized protein [Triticum aestivum]|uniref:uncharacterized protein isoform X2 n=1 Tax=Triticum aestivum TaxID=4565 RepID=UPI001D008E22|nr:uncharacterized protein LOC123125576 isoform X2 [Triticum aestivum]
MVKEEEVMAEAGGRGYLDMLGLGEEAMADYFLCLSPSSSAAVSTTTTTSASTHTVASPTCASYLAPLAAPCHHVLSFGGRAEQQYYGGGDIFGFQYYYHGAGGPAVPVAAPQKSSPTTDCSSSISTMSSSPTATAASGISTSKPQPSKKRGSRGSSDQRKAAPPAASTNKRPRARKERLGERILALQQLVSPFGKVLSSPYMQRLPPSSAPPAPLPAVVEPGDLRSRGLCLVPVSCTDHVAGGSGNGADVWSSVPAMGMPATAEEEYAVAAGMLRGDRDHHPSRQLA